MSPHPSSPNLHRHPDFVARVRDIQARQRGRLKPFTSWEDFDLLNGWGVFAGTTAPPGFHQDAAGYVHLRGALSTGPTGVTIAELPDGLAPEFRSFQPVICQGGVIAALRIDTDATLTVTSIPAPTPAWVSLDGVSVRGFQ